MTTWWQSGHPGSLPSWKGLRFTGDSGYGLASQTAARGTEGSWVSGPLAWPPHTVASVQEAVVQQKRWGAGPGPQGPRADPTPTTQKPQAGGSPEALL